MPLVSKDRFDQKNYFDPIPVSDYEALGSEFIDFLDKNAEFINYEILFREEYRIDLISISNYGFSGLFWVIRWFNRTIFIEELAKGLILKVPTLASVEEAIREFRRLRVNG